MCLYTFQEQHFMSLSHRWSYDLDKKLIELSCLKVQNGRYFFRFISWQIQDL